MGSEMCIRFFFFKQKTAYEIASCLVGSEMCIRDSVRSSADHLGRLAAEGRAPTWPGDAPPDRVTVQTHCHEYATFGNRVQRATLTALGVGSVREATGCCGVAGDFGFTAGHETVTAVSYTHLTLPTKRIV